MEKEIYNHLINFFSRYYDNGDFISKRRYGKNEKYIIPYNGEEVFLYWTNKDQYYVKTTEFFKKYTFWNKSKTLKINFRVVEAEEEKGNIKSEEKKFFILNEKTFDFDDKKNELNIYFEYRTLSNEEKERYKHGNSVSQDKINEETIKILKEKITHNLTKTIFEKEGCTSYIKDIEKNLKKENIDINLDAFILSITPYKDIKSIFGKHTIEEFEKHKILFLEDNNYINKILENSEF